MYIIFSKFKYGGRRLNSTLNFLGQVKGKIPIYLGLEMKNDVAYIAPD